MHALMAAVDGIDRYEWFEARLVLVLLRLVDVGIDL